jgi:hypothetical protein
MKQRSSVPSLHATIAAEASAAVGLLMGAHLNAQPADMPQPTNGRHDKIRASCPHKPM